MSGQELDLDAVAKLTEITIAQLGQDMHGGAVIVRADNDLIIGYMQEPSQPIDLCFGSNCYRLPLPDFSIV